MRAVAGLWERGFDHKCIGAVLDSTPASVRSIASRRGLPDRNGYTLHHEYDRTALPLVGLSDRMIERRCLATGVLFFVGKRDRATSRFCPAFKASKAYKAAYAS